MSLDPNLGWDVWGANLERCLKFVGSVEPRGSRSPSFSVEEAKMLVESRSSGII
ncbi:MAG: hypothetical protein QXV77_02435 [Candidatus Bathyarchaeia archaeon]